MDDKVKQALDFIEEYTLPEKICDDFIRYHKNNKEHRSLGYVGDVTGNLSAAATFLNVATLSHG